MDLKVMSLTVLHNANFTSQHNVTGKVLVSCKKSEYVQITKYIMKDCYISEIMRSLELSFLYSTH